MSQVPEDGSAMKQTEPATDEVTEVLIIGGQSGSGKTSSAFALHSLLSLDNVKHAVIEGDNLDLAHPAPWEYGLTEKNLAAMWTNYYELGYRKLIYTNTAAPLHVQELRNAIGGDTRVHVLVLFTAISEVRRRLDLRESDEDVQTHVQRSERTAVSLLREAPGYACRIDTGGKSVSQVASEIRNIVRW